MTSTIRPDDVIQEQWPSIVDVRNPDEYMQEHIPGSLNIPLDNLLQEIQRIHNLGEVILICRSGNRAEQAKNILEASGCQQAKVLEGGLSAWKKSKLPTQSLRKSFSIMQQVQIIAGSMVLFGWFVKPVWFLTPLAGAGLLIAGLTNTCLMATILAKMPWNRPG